MNAVLRLPKRTKIMALAGPGLVVLLLVAKFVVLRPPGPVTSPPLVVHHRATTATKRARADSGLPASLRRALAHHKVVVAVLYSPGTPGSTETVAAARQGATSAHAGFAVLDVHDELTARAAALKLAASTAPSVVVLRRPDKVDLVLPGNADSAIVAQAAAGTHR